MSTRVPPCLGHFDDASGQRRFVHSCECDAIGNKVPRYQLHSYEGSVSESCRLIQRQPIVLFAAIQAPPERSSQSIRAYPKKPWAVHPLTLPNA
jgi:hypothetical protein